MTGEFFLEIFCGAAALTLGIVLSSVPAIKPWDSNFGEAFNVLTQGCTIMMLIDQGRIAAAHFGTPCTSMTWARLPQLRSSMYPLGLPNLGKTQHEQVCIGNQLVSFTIACCLALHEMSCYFSIENPERSWLWLLNDTTMLMSFEGIEFVRFLFSDYDVPFMKPTLFLHNTPTLHMLGSPATTSPRETFTLRGKVRWQGKWTWCTKVAEAYPPALGAKFGELMKQALDMRNQALASDCKIPFAIKGEGGLVEALLQQAKEADQVHDGVAHDLVPNGMGARLGLEPLEHVKWSSLVTHPALGPRKGLTQELIAAIDFEAENSPEEIDSERGKTLAGLIHLANNMKATRQQWADKADPRNKRVVEQLHGPFLDRCLKEASGEQNLFDRLLKDCSQGFPFVGDLQPCEGASVNDLPKSYPRSLLTSADLRKNRRQINEQVLNSIKPLPFSEDIMPQAKADWEKGWMSEPRELVPSDLDEVNITRRIPVREERQNGWRTRIVDHETESLINEATRPADKIQHDSLDILAVIVTMLMAAGATPALWKRDVSSAFRRVPILAGHLDLSWVAWFDAGKFWIAQHLGMPFGTVSAVYAWHRLGHALLFIVVTLLKAPMGRYVDDYFGASRQGVEYTGGVCLTILAALVGLPTDEAKDAENLMKMVVLGATVIVDWPGKAMLTRVADDKAEKWTMILLRLLASGTCCQQDAASMAGRLSFSVTLSANRVGRAFIKAFYAQAMAPLPRNAIGEKLAWAMQWFLVYLEKRPVAVRKGYAARPQIVTWHDAAGASRWVAGVVRVEGRFLWTRIKTPQHIWDQLEPRKDSQIGFQELLGLVLLVGTFSNFLRGSLWISFGDNDGITHAMAKGGGHNDECNMAIGKIWLQVAELNADLHVARVESAANIADGPTRDDFKCLTALGAEFVPPALPDWIHDIWHCNHLS